MLACVLPLELFLQHLKSTCISVCAVEGGLGVMGYEHRSSRMPGFKESSTLLMRDWLFEFKYMEK